MRAKRSSARAQRADSTRSRSCPIASSAAGRGILAGVPIAVKDLMARRRACRSRRAATRWMPRWHGAMPRWSRACKRAGAVIVGLANLHEFAYGITSDNPRFGRVVNPAAPIADPRRIERRQRRRRRGRHRAARRRAPTPPDRSACPRACCGIAGFKPSYDALPRDGVLDLGALARPRGADGPQCRRLRRDVRRHARPCRGAEMDAPRPRGA